ncbi:PEP-CTERM sorting domain-containing protein [Gloeocapsa sp. PCC 73106]|uniref:PEP-CTERM sorting domain-containing protein n=1 Tax=Gloeocapsa sp. PCC 73106 TaxID=102232 RepID=UPI0002ACD798|nr:PEP-CTERM sorting domain-containing protein [Gloeocapsa sp. PCC 73106]ELR98528.1 PEP-CTERM putative exosortase interaction domain-containing protein [Gloeocapsa sp. PCC 73106]
MKKFNNRLSQTLLLGVVTALVGNALPAQAQTPAGVGAAEILAGCNPSNLRSFLDKCDPNADVAVDASNLPNNMPGLDGTFNVVPLGAPAGLALEGTGLTDDNGDPLTNLDFSGPSQVGFTGMGDEVEITPGSDPNAVGEFRILSSTGDFRGLLGWEGTIKDLIIPGFGDFRGEAYPTTNPAAPSPRVVDFIVIDVPQAPGNGIIDGVQYDGIALDLVDIGFPSYDPESGDNPQTTVSIQLELQAYKLLNGQRIEEQEQLPDDFPFVDRFAIYGNSVNARLSASFDFTPDEVREQYDEVGELLAFYGYDITFDSTPVSQAFAAGVVPEPTTIISSLMLMAGGAFKFSKRKRA